MPSKRFGLIGDIAEVLTGSRRAKAQESKEKLKSRLDREDRQADRRPFSLQPIDKKAKGNTKLMSPKGDVGGYNEGELHRAFPRKIKAFGKTLVSAKAIPWHGTTPMEGDKGSGVREAPKDSVVS